MQIDCWHAQELYKVNLDSPFAAASDQREGDDVHESKLKISGETNKQIKSTICGSFRRLVCCANRPEKKSN